MTIVIVVVFCILTHYLYNTSSFSDKSNLIIVIALTNMIYECSRIVMPHCSPLISNNTAITFSIVKHEIWISWLKYAIHSCTTGNIALGCGLEANIALSFASCYIIASRLLPRAIFPVLHLLPHFNY